MYNYKEFVEKQLFEKEKFKKPTKGLRKAINKVHNIQLKIQDIEKQMVDAREKFLSFPKGDKRRDPFRKQLIDLNKQKAELEKELQKAEIEFERELKKDSVEDFDFNIF